MYSGSEDCYAFPMDILAPKISKYKQTRWLRQLTIYELHAGIVRAWLERIREGTDG